MKEDRSSRGFAGEEKFFGEKSFLLELLIGGRLSLGFDGGNDEV
jgi:hypothetical protein